MLKLLFCAAALSLLSVSSGFSQDEKPTFVETDLAAGFVRFVYIVDDDQVDGGCWTNLSAVKSQVRLALERDGIAVLEDAPAFYSPAVVVLRLSGLGLRANSGLCSGYYSLKFGRFVREDWGRSGSEEGYSFSAWGEFWSSSTVLVAGSNNNEQFLEFANEAMTEFLGDYFAAKRSTEVIEFFSDFPALQDAPMSRKEFNEFWRDTQE